MTTNKLMNMRPLIRMIVAYVLVLKVYFQRVYVVPRAGYKQKIYAHGYFAFIVLYVLLLSTTKESLAFLVLGSWIRNIDDIVDHRLLETDEATTAFMNRRQCAMNALSNQTDEEVPCDIIDTLLLDGLLRCDHLGINLREETGLLFSLMLGDAVRRHEGVVRTEAELARDALRMERGFISGIIKVFGDPGKLDTLLVISERLKGLYERSNWFGDLKDDIKAGIVNVPVPDDLQHHVKQHQWDALWDALVKHPQFQKWFEEEKERLIAQWDDHGDMFIQQIKNAIRSKAILFLINRLSWGERYKTRLKQATLA